MKKKDDELSLAKADSAEVESALSKSFDDMNAQRDASEKKLELVEKKLETLKGSISRLVAAIFGKSEKPLVASVFLTFFVVFADFVISAYLFCTQRA